MKTNIIFTQNDFDVLRDHLLRGQNADEEAAFLTAGTSQTSEGLKLLVREVIPIPDDAFIFKGPAGLTFSPEFISQVVKKCRYEKLSIILAHSHPFSGSHVSFSGIDDHGEAELFPKIQQRVPDQHHGALVFGQSSIAGRIWMRGQPSSTPLDSVGVIGDSLQIYPCSYRTNAGRYEIRETYQRQVLAFKKEGQKLLEQVTVGIVGLGGVGSHVFQQLVHLGVKKFILIDSDAVEESNRSRIVGTRSEDSVRKVNKIEVMGRLGRDINPGVRVIEIPGTVFHNSVAVQLRNADVIFCCTDTMVSRMVLNRMAFQYMLPVIDMGIDIQLGNGGGIHRIGGRVMVVSPDGPCLECMAIIDHDLLTRETATPDEIQHNPYIQNVDEPAPSVITLNGVVASIATTEFLNLITGCLGRPHGKIYHVYDGRKGIVRNVQMRPITGCQLCKDVKALGDSTPLPCILNK